MGRKRPHHGSRRHGNHPAALRPRKLLTGVLHVTSPGRASVETPEGSFVVARSGIREGMDGDEVQVSLVAPHGGGPDRLAYVQAVLERATSSFVGTYSRLDPLGAVVPLDARIRRDFFVVPEDDSAERLGVAPGDVVVARILEYPARRSAGVVTLERRLGSAEELDLGVESVIASFGLRTQFSEAALAEAAGVGVDVEGALAADAARRDLRRSLCFTVDPADARDFDDAVGARRLDGGFEVWVHIADVTHYLPWDSSLDLEARQRTCSAYLVDRVVPMLPEELSCDACSLRPGEDRLTMSVRLTVSPEGELVGAEATKAAVRSSARLDYPTVDRLLAGEAQPADLGAGPAGDEVARALATLDEVARLREKVRRRRGAVDFETREARVVLDGEGRPVGVDVRSKTRATALIEEAMLMANEAVARMLADRDVPCAYRVHERPAPDDLRACLTPLRELGLVRGDEADALVAGAPEALQAILARARGASGEYLANALLLRAQRRAVYLPRNEGHYALGASAYCHFTSPIRRYPDVIVHRVLKALLAGDVASPEQRRVGRQLPQLCRDCSERERVADAAARATQRLKMAELFRGRVGESFSGVVTGCERYGLFVMLDDTLAEGLLPTRELGEEWFSYDEERLTLTGESTGRSWGLGKRVAVEVAGADPARGRIDFRLAGRRGRTPDASAGAD